MVLKQFDVHGEQISDDETETIIRPASRRRLYPASEGRLTAAFDFRRGRVPHPAWRPERRNKAIVPYDLTNHEPAQRRACRWVRER